MKLEKRLRELIEYWKSSGSDCLENDRSSDDYGEVQNSIYSSCISDLEAVLDGKTVGQIVKDE